MYLIFDTEPIGLPWNFKAPFTDTDNWPRMVWLGFILLDENGEIVREGYYYVNPNVEIPVNITRIFGVSTEMVVKYGNSMEEILHILQTVVKKSKYIIGHNVEFDYKIISAEIVRNKAAFSLKRKKRICTMHSSREFCNLRIINGKYITPKLTELYQKLFNKELLAETTREDVRATAKCFWELKSRGIIKI